MSEIKDRLLKFISSSGITVSEFERRASLSNGAVSKTNNNIRKSTLNSISSAFPNLNMDWLINGNGEMFIQSNKSGSEDGIIDYDYVPLLPVEAMAGSLQGFSDGFALRDCRKIKSPVRGADWAIQISGDSMEPDYKNGSYLYIKKMSGGFIPWGQTLVVDTLDGVVVKDIYPIENTDAVIEARSKNTKYPPFRIDMSCILGMYRVLGGSFINSTI